MNTLPRLLQHQALRRPHKAAISIKDLGIWHDHTWSDVLADVRKIAGGLSKIGVAKGDMVAVIGNNTPDIYGSIMACQALGAVPALVYANIVGVDLEKLLSRIDVKYVVAEDQQQVDAVLEGRDNLPHLQKIVYSTERGMAGYDAGVTFSLAKIKELGASWAEGEEFQKSVDGVKPDDPAMVLFNSGLKGARQPAVLSHKNLIEVAKHIAKAGNITSDDVYLSFMPISLSTNVLCGHVMSLLTGFCLSCPESPDTVFLDLRDVSPSLMYGPEYIYKHIAAMIHDRMERAGGLAKFCYQRCMQGEGVKHRPLFSEMLVHAPIRNCYGLNRMRWALIGQGAISESIPDFFRRIGINVCSIYGTAETSGCISVQSADGGGERIIGDVGPPMEGMEVKIGEGGRILCRGDGLFSGYYNDKEATDAVMRDGWFVTGDIGNVMSDGRIRVVDSETAVGHLSGGAEFHAGVIEGAIKASLYIRDAMVLGDGRDRLVACVTLEPDLVGTWADMRNLRYTGFSELASHRDVCNSLVRTELANANKNMDPKQPKISSYIVLHRQFSAAVGELTWTHKANRSKLMQNMGSAFDTAFGGGGSAKFVDPLDHEDIELNVFSMEGA